MCLKNTTTNGATTYATISSQFNVDYYIVDKNPYTTEVRYKSEFGTTKIELKCTSGVETQGDTFTRLAGSGIWNLKFSLITRHACPIQLVSNYNRNLPVLFILLCAVGGVSLLVYFTCGVFYQFVVKGARGLEIVPNIDFWKETPYLFRDGFLFVFSCYRPFRNELSNVI